MLNDNVSVADLSFDQLDESRWWIKLSLYIDIFRQEASFQRKRSGRVSLREENQLGIYVDANQCEIIGRGRYNGSDVRDPDGQPMKVHRCDGRGKVYHLGVKSMTRRGRLN